MKNTQTLDYLRTGIAITLCFFIAFFICWKYPFQIRIIKFVTTFSTSIFWFYFFYSYVNVCAFTIGFWTSSNWNSFKKFNQHIVKEIRIHTFKFPKSRRNYLFFFCHSPHINFDIFHNLIKESVLEVISN